MAATPPPVLPAVVAANRLTARWAARHLVGPTVLSGVGVWVLLAALEAGAEGEARDELAAAVGLDPADAMDGLGRVVAALGWTPAVRAALGLWFADDVPVDPAWSGALPDHVLERLSGVADADQAALDAWASEQTGGLIERMPVSVDVDTKAVLASALSVRTRWNLPFLEALGPLASGPWAELPAVHLHRTTSEVDDVRVADGGLGPVTMVRVEGRDDVDVWLLLGGPDAPPETVLEDGLAGLADLDGAVRGSELPLGRPGPGIEVSEVESSASTDQLAIGTVAFEVRASHDLLQDPALFGLAAAVRPDRGHFPGISSFPLAVGEARQDAVAVFSAQGFEAAAVAAVAMRAGSAMPSETHLVRRVSVRLDRPFGFAAVQRSSRLVLVAGWVAEPLADLDDGLS